MTRKIVTGMVLLAAACTPGVAQEERKDLNITFRVGWEGCFRPMEWTPLLLEVSSPFDKPLDCMIHLSASQDQMNELHIARREVFMPGRTRQVPLVAKLAFAVNDCFLRIESLGRDYAWAKKYNLWNDAADKRPLTAVADKDLLIGVSGRQLFGLMQLDRASSSVRRNETGTVHVKYRFRRSLPADWTAYAALDLLVLYDLDWTKLTPHQARAIVQWVTNGGKLLVVLGSRPLPPAHPIARLLPFEIGPMQEVELPASLLRRQWGAEGWKTTKLACWSLAGVRQARGWQVGPDGVPAPLQAHGPAGFGRVGLVACDPSAIGGRQQRNLAPFWIDQMKPLLDVRQIRRTNSPRESDQDYQYRLERATTAATAVLDHLYRMEELRPIHIGWVVLVLAALAVLIGPVDYLVLRRLDRLPATWITASLYIALFSVGAYYGVAYVRAGKLSARVVSVVDGIDGTAGGWWTRYVGIYSPHSDAYELSGLDRSQWWAAVAATEGDHIYRYRSKIGSSSLYCLQHVDGGNVPISVPINIWTMQCLLGEAPAAKVPLAATVRRDGAQWLVNVQNLSERPISGGYVLVSPSQRVTFGPVPAGQRGEFRRPQEPWRGWPEDAQPREGRRAQDAEGALHTALVSQGVRRRTQGILKYLADGAMVVCAVFDGPPAGFDVVAQRCAFDHKQMARLVVFPTEGSER